MESLEITMPELRIGFHVVTFRPLIPGLEEDYLFALFVRMGSVDNLPYVLLEEFRRTAGEQRADHSSTRSSIPIRINGRIDIFANLGQVVFAQNIFVSRGNRMPEDVR